MVLPQRKSVRLIGYDYSSEGLYFITICCEGFRCLLGSVRGDQMIKNELGTFVKECWLKIPAHYPHVKLHEFVVMPNHVHGIIEIGLGYKPDKKRRNRDGDKLRDDLRAKHLLPASHHV